MEFKPTIKEILFTLLAKLWQNKIKVCFAGDPRKTTHSAIDNHSFFDETNASADVSFRMILFQGVFT